MGRDYAFLGINKISSGKELGNRYDHNYRKEDVLNADPALADMNVEMVSLDGKTYAQVSKETVAEMMAEGAMKSRPRKDAVRGIEVMMTYSSEAYGSFDIEKWAKDSEGWLHDNFNPINREIRFTDYRTGKEKVLQSDNVKSLVLHMDEEVPHLHAFVVPIDDKGHLNAKYYTNGRDMFLHYQDSYAKVVAPYGLKRGERNSVATPEMKKQYREAIVRAVTDKLPDPLPEETLEAYKNRADETYRTANAHHHKEVLDLHSEINSLKAKLVTSRKEEKKLSKIIEKPYGNPLSREDRSLIREMCQSQMLMKKAFAEYPDQSQVSNVKDQMSEILEWYQYKERKRKKRKELNHAEE